MTREDKIRNNGYSFYGYEYDYDAQSEQKKLETKGYEVKLLRERTDTKGLKMYSLWIRREEK